MSPRHSIDFCPICGGGLCGIRVCGIPPHETGSAVVTQYDSAHGLVVCDECEAIWLAPDVTTDHQYPAPDDASCPICDAALWGETSRWANSSDIAAIGWSDAVNHDLDVNPDEGLV
ncbi:MAG: hypothetical protein HKN47_05210 [Pirellulaceae bacterium]|nr:hypothetical protein [Pirellulaceae bacterium]